MPADINADVDALADALYAAPVNDTQHQTPVDGATDLFAFLPTHAADLGLVPEEAAYDLADDPVGELGAVLDGEILDPLPDDLEPPEFTEIDDPVDALMDVDGIEKTDATEETQTGNLVQNEFSLALTRSVSDLDNALNPMDINELNDRLSRGQFNANTDPQGDRLRTTIRAMMRRNA